MTTAGSVEPAPLRTSPSREKRQVGSCRDFGYLAAKAASLCGCARLQMDLAAGRFARTGNKATLTSWVDELVHEGQFVRNNRRRRGSTRRSLQQSDRRSRASAMTRLLVPAVLASALVACGRSMSYPLRTCVVCDQPLAEQTVEFVHDHQTVKVCSEAHRAEFAKDPSKYLGKIKEVKVL